MDSHDFFFNNAKDSKTGLIWKEKFNNKTGIYIVEQPLFKWNGQRVFKVGMADGAGLTRRLADYNTAYAHVSFQIHLLWAIPKVIGSIARLQYNTEQHIHKTLRENGKHYDKHAKEWFVDLGYILAVVYKIKEVFENTFIVDNKKTEWYLKDFSDVKVRMSRAKMKLSNPEDILIKTPKGYSDLFVIDRTNVRRKADLGQRYTANEMYIGDRRAVVGKYNEDKKKWEIIYDVPMSNDKKYFTEKEILKYIPKLLRDIL